MFLRTSGVEERGKIDVSNRVVRERRLFFLGLACLSAGPAPSPANPAHLTGPQGAEGELLEEGGSLLGREPCAALHVPHRPGLVTFGRATELKVLRRGGGGGERERERERKKAEYMYVRKTV